MDDQPTKKRLAVALLICGLALGAALLLLRAGARNTLSHDDVISYLAATGHMGSYATDIPAGRWVPAQTWQAYWTPDRFGVFRQIGRDLARYDIHPPLYFWLLHAWIQVTGVRLSAGPLLNTVFLLLGAWLIALACRLANCSRSASTLAAVTWLLSGATLSAAGATRQYSLLSLMVAGLAVGFLLFLERRSLAAAVLVYAAATAGLLTHYQFAAILALGALVVAILLARGRQWRAVVLLAAAVTASLITFLFLHPTFMGSFAMQRVQASAFTWAEVPYRIVRISSALFEQVMLPQIARTIANAAASYWGIVLFLVLVAGLGMWLIARRKARRGRPVATDSEVFVPIFAAVALLLVSALYIFQFSPRHAMGAQYLMAVSPLLFMAGAMVFDRLTSRLRWRSVLILALIACQAAYGGWTTRVQVRMASERPAAVLDSGSPVLLDSVARGVLPAVLWHVRGSTPVYAAMQDDLLDDFPVIPGDVRRLVYVSDLRYGNNTDKQTRVLEQLAAQSFGAVARRGSLYGAGEVFEVTR